MWAGWLASALAASPAVSLAPAERDATRAITENCLRSHVAFLASDELEGRGPSTRGDRLTQRYLVAQLQGLGLLPAGEAGSYLQPFDMVGVTARPEPIELSAGGRRLQLLPGDEAMVVAGRDQPHARVDRAEVVFVGYGIVAPEFGWDDFKGADLRGKVLLVMNNDPEDDPAIFGGKARLWYGRWDYKFQQAAAQGALGALIVHTTPSAGYPWKVVQTSWAGEQFSLPGGDGRPLALRGWLTEDASRKLARLGGFELDKLRAAAERRDFRPVKLGVALTGELSSEVQSRRSANVLAWLPGSDPLLSAEAVVYTAHHDHLGQKAGVAPGETAIFHGAVDNALGVASMLCVARAYAALPTAPRRSVLFAAVAAEEQGLLGSQYLVAHPPVPLARMALDINADGGNIWGRTRDVSQIGMGKSNVDALLGALAALQGRQLRPDQNSDKGFFYRSDQFSFARGGVPSAYFGSGESYLGRPDGWGRKVRDTWLSSHYHQPSDQPGTDWELSGAVEDAQLSFWLGLKSADGRPMPEWNPTDEFAAVRRRSLEALRAGSSNAAKP